MEKRALKEGLDIRHYLNTITKVGRTPEEARIVRLVEQMRDDAAAQGINLHMERLLRRDEAWLASAGQAFEEARQAAQESGVELTLPEMAPRNTRKCEFVEGNSAFVSSSPGTVTSTPAIFSGTATPAMSAAFPNGSSPGSSATFGTGTSLPSGTTLPHAPSASACSGIISPSVLTAALRCATIRARRISSRTASRARSLRRLPLVHGAVPVPSVNSRQWSHFTRFALLRLLNDIL